MSVALPAYFAGQGYGKSEIAGYLAIITLPWGYKFLAGPLMDRFSAPELGHRRPWIIGAQGGLMLAFILAALVSPLADSLMMFAWIGFVLNCFATTQDVAVDGLAIGVLKENERARANAFMFGGASLGFSFGGFIGGHLLDAVGFPGTFLVLACFVGFVLTFPILFKERAVEKRFPWSEGKVAPEIAEIKVDRIVPMLAILFRSLFNRGSLLVAAAFLLMNFSVGQMNAYLTSFTVQDLGWEDTDSAGIRSLAVIFAMIEGITLSPVIDKVGQRNTIVTVALIVAVIIFGYSFLPASYHVPGPDTDVWKWFLYTIYSLDQLYTIAFFATCMFICNKSVAATQFAIYMACANIGSICGSWLISTIGDDVSIVEVLYIASAGMVVAPVIYVFSGMGKRNQLTESTETLAEAT